MSRINEMIAIVMGCGRISGEYQGFKVLGEILSDMESRLKKMEIEKELAESRESGFEKRIADLERSLNTLSQEVSWLSWKQEKAAEKYNRELAECNKDIIGTHMTLMNYKRENNMLGNRIDDLNKENQSKENGIDVLRLKLIDVLDEVEKNTSEAAEIKRMAFDIYGKNREYDRNFGASMTRMNELEKAMKSVTIHYSDIRSMKEKINVLEQNLIPNS